jgi:hypothetical protein
VSLAVLLALSGISLLFLGVFYLSSGASNTNEMMLAIGVGLLVAAVVRAGYVLVTRSNA